jgi:hypothetical protein
VAGILMMLALLLYPLRKRFKLFENLGGLPNWFNWHIVLGILGPLTIIFHSTYHVYIPYLHPKGSLNAAVAMLCMLLVSASGTFGRFFYTKIHNGLFSYQTTLNELRSKLENAESYRALFSLAPGLEKTLQEILARAYSPADQSNVGLVKFIMIGFNTMSWSRRARMQVAQNQVMHVENINFPTEQRLSKDALVRDFQDDIADYFEALRIHSQFHTYERLFSWWHIFHIPLVYMMVFSALYHVYAVHAY